jgi:hypothetical protein
VIPSDYLETLIPNKKIKLPRCLTANSNSIWLSNSLITSGLELLMMISSTYIRIYVMKLANLYTNKEESN